mmetsp:Transcript_2115/g.3204  ORF Transcript_2115/g.3204 Transcript_2115/m.3204 type:complete len:83 (-) Transcript_2115:278-526(-)
MMHPTDHMSTGPGGSGASVTRCQPTAVFPLTEQNLWAAVPDRDHLMGVWRHWQLKSPCKPKVCQLQDSVRGHQQILRFEIPV